jgi:hypothetical protein
VSDVLLVGAIFGLMATGYVLMSRYLERRERDAELGQMSEEWLLRWRREHEERPE